MTRSFLLIGIAWEELSTVVGEEKAPEFTKMVKDAITKDEARFVDAGLKFEFTTYGTQEKMDRLEAKLEEGKYDGVAM